MKVRERLWEREKEIYSDRAKRGKKQRTVSGMCIRRGGSGSGFPYDADPGATLVRLDRSLLEGELTTRIGLEGSFKQGCK